MKTLFRRALMVLTVTGLLTVGASQTYASAAARTTERVATAVWTLTSGCVETQIVVYSSQSVSDGGGGEP
jgi:hypothetical protein